jgi:hypothetical protein
MSSQDFDIDAEADTEQVDELLAACLKTALSQSKVVSSEHGSASGGASSK